MKVLSNLLIFITLLFSISVSQVTAQKSNLEKQFKEYEVVKFDTKALKSLSAKRSNDFIQLPFVLSSKYKWNLELTTHQIFSDKFIARFGKQTKSREDLDLPIVLRGYSQTSNDIHAVITVNDGFLYGRVATPNEVIFFEPARTFDKNAKPDDIVVYKQSDVIENELGTCASDKISRKKEHLELRAIEKQTSSRSSGPCIQVDLAIANDHTVYNDEGSSNSNVLAFNAGVIASVNTDYDDDFNNEISFVIVETYTATNSGQNSWGRTSDASALLSNFTSWANGGGFQTTHDLGELWTDDNLQYQGNSSTIGLAWVGVVCGNSRYHVLEKFSSNAPSLRNLVSHEIGHNFNLSHVGESNKIMTGSVSGTDVWSTTSINALNSYLTTISCLGACTGTPPDGGGGSPPEANFDATLLQECNPTLVRLNDLSSNSPTSWSWQIENGNPSTSTLQNPEVIFPGSGSYRITLTATNADGSDTRILQMNLNNVGDPPSAAFSFVVNDFNVSFNNNTTNGQTYNWDFGDGESSVTANPSHIYDNPGTYTVVLTSSNDCGSDTETQTVSITDQVSANFVANTTNICPGGSVSFDNQSSSNVESYFWEFENGSPSTSTQENPTVTYNSSGTFNVRLTVTGGGTSDIENKTNHITVNSLPNASFTETIDGYAVAFDNNTTGGISYSWDFGDGNTSSSANPNHNYAGPGTYSVTLTSTNSCGSDDFVRTITIADEVIADFQATSTQGCSGDEFTFNSTSSGNITSYFWEFQDGIPATSTDENPTVVFSSTGTKTARLTVSNSLYEDTENKLNYIDIITAPDVDFEFIINENTVEFDNNTVGGLFYAWDFGDGNTTTTPNPTYTYSGPGDYIVTLSSNNNCEENEISKTVSIESNIIARFTSTDQEICGGESIQFTNTSEGSITGYFWEFEGGNPSTSSQENPSVTYASPGNYNVKLTVTDGVIEDAETKLEHIIVSEGPAANFETDINGYEVSFLDLSEGATNYSWNFGDGQTSATGNPVHSYTAPGEYTVILTAENDCGIDEISKVVKIIEIVEADFTSSDIEICTGEMVNFDNSSFGDIAGFFWEFEGGTPSTSTEENPEVSYLNSGTFNVKLTITGAFGTQDSKEIAAYVSVDPGPIADFTYIQTEKTLTFNNISEYYNEYIWDFGDGNTSTDENPSHTYAEEGNYIVKLQIGGPCGLDEKQIEIPVFDVLLANFQASETTLCPGQEVMLEDLSSGNPTEWEWSIMGEEMIYLEGQNPVLALEEPGIYTVELTVRNDEEEDTKLIQQYIEVMPLPEVNFDYVQNELILTFSNNSQNGKSYYWDFGDGSSSTEPNPSHEYAEEGNYVVMLRVENDCSVIDSEQEISVFKQLTAGFSAGATEICENSEIEFNNQSSGNASSWEWSFPGGSPSTSNERNPVVVYETAGVYDVILKVNGEAEAVTETKTDFVVVNKLPIANFEFEVDKNQVQFYNLSENGATFEWSFESEEMSPIIEFEEEKAYEVFLITSNACASDTFTQIIDLYEEANTYANFSIAANSYCLGDEISFIDLSSEDITEWSWKFPGASPAVSNEKNPVVVYEEFGTFDVELTVSNGFNERTLMFEDYVSIVEKPVAKFSLVQTNNFIKINNESQFSSEVLYYIDGVKFEEDLPYYTFAKNGVFEVKQIVRNSCGESTFTQEVEIDVYPSAGFSLDVAQGCAPLEVRFQSKSTDNATSVKWLLEGSETPEIEGLNPRAIYNDAGVFSIKVIAINQFGSDTLELNSLIEVFDQPIASFEYVSDGLNIDFAAIAEEYDSVKWDLGDGTTSDLTEFSHEYQEGRLYPIILQVFRGQCSDVFTDEIDLRSSSIDEIDASYSVKVFPNPSDAYLIIHFNKEIGKVNNVSVIDQLGRQILYKDMNSSHVSEITLDNLNSIPPGHYFVAIGLDDAETIYKKVLIVR